MVGRWSPRFGGVGAFEPCDARPYGAGPVSLWEGILTSLVVPILGGVLWIIRRVEQHGIEIFGPTRTNGLRGDVKELKAWRETMPKQFEATRHLLRNEFQGDLGELELRVRALERQR